MESNGDRFSAQQQAAAGFLEPPKLDVSDTQARVPNPPQPAAVPTQPQAAASPAAPMPDYSNAETTLKQLEKVVSEFMIKYPSHTQRIPAIRPGEHALIAF
ncbi:MAG: hypothetical protein AAGC68_00805, partial [Verrucomicrobiota bacterium]